MKHLIVMGMALFLGAGLNAQVGQRAGERAISETEQIAEKPAEQGALTAAEKRAPRGSGCVRHGRGVQRGRRRRPG